MDDATRQEMARLYGQGLTTRDVGEATGFCSATVWKTLQRMGVALRPKGQAVGQSRQFDRDEAARLYQEGYTQARIAAHFGVTQGAIALALKAEGVACQDARHLDWPIEDMRRWYEEDRLTVEQIAQRLGRQRVATNKVLRRNKIAMRRRGPKDGPEHTGWKGGRKIEKPEGYILVWMPDHPHANHSGYVREHRLVVEKVLGRYLLPTEVVHHKNDDPADNRPENLQVFASNADHLAETLKGKCPQWTAGGKARILEAVVKPRQSKASRTRPTPDDPGSPGTTPRSTT